MTFTYKFRDGQKEAYEAHLRRLAGIYSEEIKKTGKKSRAAVTYGRLHDEVGRKLAELESGEFSEDGIAALESFAYSNRWGQGTLQRQGSGVYLTRCVYG